MNLLLTGCAGFIGSHLSERLLKDGHTIYGIDNLDPISDLRMKHERLLRLKKYDNFFFFQNDINDKHKMDLIFADKYIDKILHLAARAGVRTSIKLPISFVDNNIRATNILLEYSITNEIRDFIFASSSSVYGNANGPFKEDMVIEPISPYAASKRACELYGSVYSKLSKINFTSLRFFSVYGPGQRTDMAISRFTKWISLEQKIQLFGDGTIQRDFTYVDDIVEGFVLAMNKSYKNEIFNLGVGETITILQLIALIEKEVGKKALIAFLPKQKGDVNLTFADITKAEKMLNYSPKTSITDGIKKYVKWYSSRIQKED